jgi:hypothetical protein
VAFCLSDYWSVDITNHRKDANWREYLAGDRHGDRNLRRAHGPVDIRVVRGPRDRPARRSRRVPVPRAPCRIDGRFSPRWAYNLVGYLLVVLVAYCGVHLAFRCMVAPKARRGSS